MADTEINLLSLCSGVGGLDLGVRLAVPGSRVVGYVEREAYCAAVLLARMEDEAMDAAPVWCGDLAEFDGRPWRGAVDGIVAGIPCQPHSVAGKRLGAADERNLWPAAARIIGEVEPEFVFLENVGGATRFFLEHVGGELERAGWRIAAGLFSAAEVGAPHRRERLFLLADRTGLRCQGTGQGPETMPKGGKCLFGEGRTAMANSGDRLVSQPGRGSQSRDGAGSGGAELADAEEPGLEGREPAGNGQTDGCPAEYDIPLFPPGPADLDGWRRVLESDPTLEPAICGVADGMAPRVDRLRACGNGVLSLQAAWALVCLAGVLYGR